MRLQPTSIQENTTAVHTFSANESVTWSLNAGNDASKFTIDSTTGALVFDSAPDYENPTDVGDTAGNNTYVVSVRATDSSGNTADQAVTITVTDADEVAPNITGPSGSAGDASSANIHPRKYNRCSYFLRKRLNRSHGHSMLEMMPANSPLIPQPALWSLIPLPITKIQPTKAIPLETTPTSSPFAPPIPPVTPPIKPSPSPSPTRMKSLPTSQGPQAPLVMRLQQHPSKKIQPLFILSPQTNRSHGHSMLEMMPANSPLIPQPALWSLIPLPITKIQPT